MFGKACCFFQENTSAPHEADHLIGEEANLLASQDERCDPAGTLKSAAWLCCASTFAASAVAGMIYVTLIYGSGSISDISSDVSEAVSSAVTSYSSYTA